jgi:hypothetical protein
VFEDTEEGRMEGIDGWRKDMEGVEWYGKEGGKDGGRMEGGRRVDGGWTEGGRRVEGGWTMEDEE